MVSGKWSVVSGKWYMVQGTGYRLTGGAAVMKCLRLGEHARKEALTKAGDEP